MGVFVVDYSVSFEFESRAVHAHCKVEFKHTVWVFMDGMMELPDDDDLQGAYRINRQEFPSWLIRPSVGCQ